jgi:RNA polymerase sigma-70 factor (ECF subfamily)
MATRSVAFYPTPQVVPASIVRVHAEPDRDVELVERARAGETSAFGELVERHRSAIYRAALAALRNPADAEDVAQDALVLAFRKLDQFRGDASVRTWMITIAWRLALSRRRSPMHRLKQMISRDHVQIETVSAQPSAERCVLDGERLSAVQRQIQGLPPKLRDAVLLTAAGDLTQDEIAATLGIPAATFRWRVMEARKRLKRSVRL